MSRAPRRGRRLRDLARLLNRGIEWIESRPFACDAPLPYPPIFVVGAPRSGTTLAYQIVIEAFDVGYLSNLHGWLWGAPSAVERVLRRMRARPRADFRSELGNTRGALDPSECAIYWHRFLPAKPDVIEAGAVGPERRRRLRAALARLLRASGRAMVFKTVQNDGRLKVLVETLPEALYLVVRRDAAANERSLLAARLRVHGTESRWWSFEVPGFEALAARPAAEQVREQVRRTRLLIDDALRDLPRERVLAIDYEEICARPRAVVEAIAALVSPRGVGRRTDACLPESFSRPAATARLSGR